MFTLIYVIIYISTLFMSTGVESLQADSDDEMVFMRRDDTLLPTRLLDTPPMLPFQVFGFGGFTPWDKTSLYVKCPADSVPERKTEGAAGYDLVSKSSVTIAPGSSGLIQTGVHIAIPDGYYGKIEGRSSLGIKHSVVPFQGVIDSDYRGPIIVKLFNHARTKYRVAKGDRVAQLIINPYLSSNMIRVDELPSTARGEAGFGSTGK